MLLSEHLFILAKSFDLNVLLPLLPPSFLSSPNSSDQLPHPSSCISCANFLPLHTQTYCPDKDISLYTEKIKLLKLGQLFLDIHAYM